MLVGLLLALCPGLLAAQDSAIPREFHPWGRFPEGAWKRYRVTAETYDNKRTVTSTTITETTTTLEKIDSEGVTLLVETMADVAGKHLNAEPKTVKQGFHGEPVMEKIAVKDAGADEVTIDLDDRRKVSCKIVQVETEDHSSRTITKIFCNSGLPPYILRRESVTTDLDGRNTLSQTTLQVVSLKMPYKALRLRSAVHVKAVTTHPKGKTTTYAYTSPEVPGGVICQSTQEEDLQGNVLRKSNLELLDYGSEPEKDRPGFFSRLRNRHKALRSSAR